MVANQTAQSNLTNLATLSSFPDADAPQWTQNALQRVQKSLFNTLTSDFLKGT